MHPDYPVILFYKYVPLVNPERFAASQRVLCNRLGLKGRILIATEGINGTLAGPRAAIEEYIALIDPFDKAGAYAAQEHGDRLIAAVSGSWTNVMGLPMEALTRALARHGILPGRRPWRDGTRSDWRRGLRTGRHPECLEKTPHSFLLAFRRRALDRLVRRGRTGFLGVPRTPAQPLKDKCYTGENEKDDGIVHEMLRVGS